jgi:C1A family cysteine protease
MSITPYRLGWRRDTHDPRDIPYEASPSMIAALPSQVSLASQCPPVYDQGNLGSCTANAIAGAFEFDLLRQGLADFRPSRLFIYYFERLMEGDVSEDNGAQIRDGIKVVNGRGVCPETEWPYDITRFADAPPAQCTIDALKDKALQYRRIPQDLTQMKACLASGLPYVGGINVYQSFMDASDGVIPMPTPGEQCIGGHAILFCGFDDATQRFLFRNSWGTGWPAHSTAQPGYGTIPYAYLESGDASDFWAIRVVGSVVAQLRQWIDGLL